MILRSYACRLPRLVACLVALPALVAARAALAQSPNFDAVPWTPLGCDVSPLSPTVTGADSDLVGDAAFPAAFTARDASYLYFRLRVSGNPAGFNGFTPHAWTVLVQTPSGNPFQFQYQLSLNGNGMDPLEIWRNTVPQDFSFSDPTADNSEDLLWSRNHATLDPLIGNSAPLARSVPTNDGSAFKNDPDFFVDMAFPVSALLEVGAVTSATQLDAALFWPATDGTQSNRHTKDRLNCPFLPVVPVVLGHAVEPTQVTSNVTTPVRYTITVQNAGARAARGLTVSDGPFPPYLSSITVSTSADGPGVAPVVLATNPLSVRVPELPAGRTLTIRVDANALGGCGAGNAVSTAGARGMNALAVTAAASLQVVDANDMEICDGLDNDCDGQVDEGGDALCNDANACNGTETCGGTARCIAGPPVDCGDGNPCTTDACTPANGQCTHTTIPACTGCQNAVECSDGDPCTADTCSGGACANTAIPNCTRCTTPAQCNDGNGCTTDGCTPDGRCNSQTVPGCVTCTTPAQCDDGNACTADACSASGTCAFSVVPGCTACTTAAECNDGNACTTDACTNGACSNVPVDPVPEVCGDAVDNDCDGDTDCADADCTAVPACAPGVEVCGNCTDDDRDGLTDYEDADCCAAPMSLAVAQMRLRPNATARVKGERLRLTAVYSPTTPAFFDPTSQDTSFQVSDGTGQLYCATIPAAHWKRGKGLSIRFKDRAGTVAGGLTAGSFVVNRRGNLVFDARGRKVVVRDPAGSSVQLTVRVGDQCARSVANLRAQKKKLVFP